MAQELCKIKLFFNSGPDFDFAKSALGWQSPPSPLPASFHPKYFRADPDSPGAGFRASYHPQTLHLFRPGLPPAKIIPLSPSSAGGGRWAARREPPAHPGVAVSPSTVSDMAPIQGRPTGVPALQGLKPLGAQPRREKACKCKVPFIFFFLSHDENTKFKKNKLHQQNARYAFSSSSKAQHQTQLKIS